MYKKNVLEDSGPNPHTAAATHKESFDRPTSPHSPKRDPQVRGGVRGGVFAQRAHSANYYGDYPGNNPKNHPPCGIMHNHFKTQKLKHLMLAMGPRDLNSAPYSPVHCSSHSMTSFQSSELTALLVVENSQLFAQRAHSACTAHGTPPRGSKSRFSLGDNVVSRNDDIPMG